MYTQEGIQSYLQTPGLQIHIKNHLPSTNTTLKEWAEKGASEGTVLLARRQDKGRGRKGRSFFSPMDTGIYMSILLRPALMAEDALRITTTAAVAVAQTLSKEAGVEAKIKWVNDVYCFDKKVCGILTEGSVDPDSATLRYAVLGIGINVLPPKDNFPEDFRSNATAVADNDCNQLGDRLIAGVLDCFFGYYGHLQDNEILQEYKSLCCTLGQEVEIVGKDIFGTARDIDNQFRLILEASDGTVHTLDSGEISVRKRA